MFRRLWSGLPADPVFPADLEQLGYFVDPQTDEIRLIDEPSYYYNYFHSKNTRHNDRQRFAFHTAVQRQLIQPRLEALGLARLALPLGAGADEPHVPIMVSRGLEGKARVVVIFGEGEQELGVVAHRVAGGPGGVDKGSMVGVARAVLEGGRGAAASSPGVVLANTGELWWWPEGGRGLSPRGVQGVPMKSAVHWGRFYDARANAVPCNGDVDAHVACVFESVLGNADFVGEGAVVQVIGVGDGAVAAERYLDRNWARWGARVGCLAMLGAGLDIGSVGDDGFKRFLREKTRLYVTSQEPVNTPISGPEGNDQTVVCTDYGTHIFSSGEKYYTELTLIKARDVLLAWMAEVHAAGGGYCNPDVEVTYADEHFEETPGWGEGGGWEEGTAGVTGGGRQSTASQDKDEGGLEIITRDEWEARMRKEGKDKQDAAIPDNVFVVGKAEEQD